MYYAGLPVAVRTNDEKSLFESIQVDSFWQIEWVVYDPMQLIFISGIKCWTANLVTYLIAHLFQCSVFIEFHVYSRFLISARTENLWD